MFKWLVNFYTPYLLEAPDTSSGGTDLDALEAPPDDKETTDDTDTTESDTDDEEDTEPESEDETEDEDEEDKDAEEDEKESDDEDENARLTHASDLKKSYPDIFKKFPDVKAALYRDQEYSELFGTPKDAEVAVNKANLLDRIEKDLLVDGNPVELLNSIKKDSKESFEKIAYKILPYLAENDRETYLEVAAVPIKQLLRSMISKYGADTNEHKAALYVHQYFFDNLDVTAKTKAETDQTTKKSDKEREYETKLKEIDDRDLSTFSQGVDTSYLARMNKVFREGLEKDDRLSDWMKSKIVENGLLNIANQLKQDPRFNRTMRSLWQQAKSSQYSNDLKSRLVSTALARAKSLIPKERAKLVAEALGKKVKKDSDNKDSEKSPNVHRFEKKATSVSKPITKSRILSDKDILMGKG